MISVFIVGGVAWWIKGFIYFFVVALEMIDLLIDEEGFII